MMSAGEVRAAAMKRYEQLIAAARDHAGASPRTRRVNDQSAHNVSIDMALLRRLVEEEGLDVERFLRDLWSVDFFGSSGFSVEAADFRH